MASRASALSAFFTALKPGGLAMCHSEMWKTGQIIRRTLLKLLDSREINDVMRRIFVNATNTSYQANQRHLSVFEDG